MVRPVSKSFINILIHLEKLKRKIRVQNTGNINTKENSCVNILDYSKGES